MHQSAILGMFVGAMSFGSVACGDSGQTATDTTTQSDTGVVSDTDVTADTETPSDTTVTAEIATATETIIAETSVAETEPGDTGAEAEIAEETCGCEGGSSCLQAKSAQACVSVTTSCGGGGMHRVDACNAAEAQASCERSGTIQYAYWARIKGWLQNAKDACAQAIGGPAGTFVVAEIPAAVGAPCSCQRSAAACTQTYGDACATLTCEAPEGLQTTLCPNANRLAPRCVTRDGQRELVFYTPGATLEAAEMSCNGASIADYYWFPDGL